jgi:DNA-binding LacI/PurR family transcriptional regulator
MVPVPLEGLDCTLVHAANRAGMRDAVLHLIAHGHRRIAYVDHGPETWSQQRYLGYCDALDAHAIARDPALVLHTEVVATDGVESHIERG